MSEQAAASSMVFTSHGGDDLRDRREIPHGIR